VFSELFNIVVLKNKFHNLRCDFKVSKVKTYVFLAPILTILFAFYHRSFGKGTLPHPREKQIPSPHERVLSNPFNWL